MRCSGWAVVLTMLVEALWTAPSRATEEVVVQVAQPVWAEGEWFIGMTHEGIERSRPLTQQAVWPVEGS
jgi:hypothetical protein